MKRNFIVSPKIAVTSSDSVKSARDYGGAYDIDSDMFFTKDDLMELSDKVIEILTESGFEDVELSDIYIEGHGTDIIHIEVAWPETGEYYEYSITVDMRRIRKPSDLRDKYGPEIADALRESMRESIDQY